MGAAGPSASTGSTIRRTSGSKCWPRSSAKIAPSASTSPPRPDSMTTEEAERVGDEAALLDEIRALLADPAHAGNPLRPVLERLHDLHRRQSERLQRLVRISDGYHGMARE